MKGKGEMTTEMTWDPPIESPSLARTPRIPAGSSVLVPCDPMSTVCVIEPLKKGKVVLDTTHGPLDVELWRNEAPKAVRNFVQPRLDDTIFRRIIKDFLVQGGDPTGTGTGGESLYVGAFFDEYRSRLWFKHRGLVACVNEGTPHSNGRQLFITWDRYD